MPGLSGVLLWDPPVGPAGDRVGVVLTHGAGGDCRGPGLASLAAGLAARGHHVARFDLPYRVAGRKAPPAAEASVPAFAGALAAAGDEHPGVRGWAAGGKSYGGRVASLAVAGGLEAAALVFYGYPLHPPGRPERLRVDHWPSITVPCLFLQGTSDPFCDLGLLQANLPALGGPARLEVVEGGDHSLGVAGARSPDGRARSESEVLARVAGIVSAWLAEVAS